MRLRKQLIINLRWHRRLGLSVFVFVIFLALSGIALNHTSTLKLGDIRLNSGWLLGWYGLAMEDMPAYNASGNWLYSSDAHLYFNREQLTSCPELLSATHSELFIAALCPGRLLLLTSDGQLIDSLDESRGLPTNIDSLHSTANKLLAGNSLNSWQIDPDSFQVTALARGVTATPLERLPDELAAQINSSSVSLETVILDLHSGRFFGGFGVFVVDLVGLLIVALSVTGLWSWVNHQKLRRM